MPTRAIKFRLHIPRGNTPAEVEARRALWATYRGTNEAVERYEGVLLEMRQRAVTMDVDGEEKTVGASEWRNWLCQRLCSIGVRHEHIDKACVRLRELYLLIVQSAAANEKAETAKVASALEAEKIEQDKKGKKEKAKKVKKAKQKKTAGGKAQAAMRLHSALVLAAAKTGARERATFAWLEPVIAVIDAGGDEEAVRQAAEHLIATTGSPEKYADPRTSWVAGYMEKPRNQKWVQRLITWVSKRRKEITDGHVLWLQAHGVLPIMTTWSQSRVHGMPAVGVFERAAFALAAGRLNSWEAWNKITADRRDALQARVANWERLYTESHATALAAVRVYEAARGEHLKATALWAADSIYRIWPRELRNWPDLRDWLHENPTATADQRQAKLKEIQAEKKRSAGGYELLSWLAAPEQQWLVDHPNGDVVARIALLNLYARKADVARERAKYTPPHAQLHPLHPTFDPINNSNSPPFVLRNGENGRLELEIELLAPVSDDADPDVFLCRKRFRFELAPTEQCLLPRVETITVDKKSGGSKDCQRLRYRPQDGIAAIIDADVGGSALIFERAATATAHRDALMSGELGKVYFRVSVDQGLDTDAAELRSGVRRWLGKPLHERATDDKLPRPYPGMRVLAVDLGVEVAAAISVYQLCETPTSIGVGRPGRPTKSWCSTAPVELYAHHERSALLRLNGDVFSERDTEAMHAARVELRGIQAAVRRLRDLTRLYAISVPAERRDRIDLLADKKVHAAVVAADADALRALEPHADADMAVWQSHVLALYRDVEEQLGVHIHDWRKRDRARRANENRTALWRARALGAKSLNRIEYLQDVYRLLVSWHRHHPPGVKEPRRLDRERFGSVASRLSTHTTKLKDDRAATTANLIVHAARGNVYEGGRWVHKHAPVDIIVFENLTRYAFRTDRPAFENRMIMRWCHRAVAQLAAQQAEVYGIATTTTPAAFTSRLDARTGAPGTRCIVATHAHIEALRGSGGKETWYGKILAQYGIDIARVEVGDLLPIERGRAFVSITPGGGLRRLHADVNAAQGVATLYLSGHGTAFRIPANKLTGGKVAVNVSPGPLLMGALGGKAVALEGSNKEGFDLKVFATPGALGKAYGIKVKDVAEDMDDEGTNPTADDEDDLDLLEAAKEERRLLASREVYLRDPSGQMFGGKWMPQKKFWEGVRAEVVVRLREKGLLHG